MADRTFLSLIEIDVMSKCHPCIVPKMLLEKITEIENHYARIVLVTKFGEVQWLISPTNLTFDYFKEIPFTFSL